MFAYKRIQRKITNICIQIKLLRTHVILTPQPLPYLKIQKVCHDQHLPQEISFRYNQCVKRYIII